MKSLKQYIAESVHLYEYTVKIAGEVDKNFLDLFKYNLKKFEPVEMSDPVTTPIQKNPYGFAGLENMPVTIIKCKFRYPTSEPMIQQMAQLLGHNLNYVRVVSTDLNDQSVEEAEAYENQLSQSPILDKTEMDSAPGAEEANKAYGESYLSVIKDRREDTKMDIPYAGDKTPDSFDPFKPETYVDQTGSKSPMSNISRPEKPKTGAGK